MKRNKTICIDEDIIEELSKVENGSQLINELLRDFFGSAISYKKEELLRKLKELSAFIIEKKEEEEMLKTKLEKIIIEEDRLRKLFKNVPKEILDDFKTFPNMTSEILEMRIRDIYSDKYPNMNYKIIWEAFNEFFKDRTKENGTPKQTD